MVGTQWLNDFSFSFMPRTFVWKCALQTNSCWGSNNAEFSAFTSIITTPDAAERNIPDAICHHTARSQRITFKLNDVWDVNTKVVGNGKWNNQTRLTDAKWKFIVTVATHQSLPETSQWEKYRDRSFFPGASSGHCDSDLHGTVYAGVTQQRSDTSKWRHPVRHERGEG